MAIGCSRDPFPSEEQATGDDDHRTMHLTHHFRGDSLHYLDGGKSLERKQSDNVLGGKRRAVVAAECAPFSRPRNRRGEILRPIFFSDCRSTFRVNCKRMVVPCSVLRR